MKTAKKTAKKSTVTTPRNAATRFVTKKVFVGKREDGVRQQAQSVIPKSGATLEQISAAAKKRFSLPANKVAGYIGWLAANKYVARVAL